MSQTDTRPFAADNDHEGSRDVYPPSLDGPAPGPLDEIRNGLKVWADVGLTLGKSIDANTNATRKLWDRLQRNTPVDYGIGVAGVYPATGFLLLSFGTPDQGYRWEVTNVTVGGVDADTTAAGSAGLYVSGALPTTPGGRAPAGMTGLVDRAATLPNPAFYGTRQLVVDDQEYLFLIIFGGTVGQTYAANFSATVFPDDAGGGRDVVTL